MSVYDELQSLDAEQEDLGGELIKINTKVYRIYDQIDDLINKLKEEAHDWHEKQLADLNDFDSELGNMVKDLEKIANELY